MRRYKGQKGFSFGMRGSERVSSETLCASLTPVGLSSVCLSVCLTLSHGGATSALSRHVLQLRALGLGGHVVRWCWCMHGRTAHAVT